MSNGETEPKQEIEQRPLSELPKSEKSQTLRIIDASSEGARILVPQLGSDHNDIEMGRVDVRRLTKINEMEKIWLSYFLLVPKDEGGDYAKDFCNNWMNLAMSENGERARQLILMQGAVTGGSLVKRKAEDKRSWIQKHLTQRSKEPGEELDVGVSQTE